MMFTLLKTSGLAERVRLKGICSALFYEPIFPNLHVINRETRFSIKDALTMNNDIWELSK